MTQTIYVPVDGSNFGEQALSLSLTLARRTSSSLHLALVHEPIFLAEPTAGGAMLSERADAVSRDREKEYLRDLAERVSKVVNTPVGTRLLEGTVVSALLDNVKATQPHWLVMSTHGRGPMSRFWLGSVTDGLLRASPVPLLLVRPKGEALDLSKDIVIRHVLICLDGSAIAERVLESAVGLAKILSASVRLIRVVKPPLVSEVDPTRADPEAFGQPETRQMQTQAEQYLVKVADRLGAQSVQVEHMVEVDRQAAAAVLRHRSPDTLIALSTHGRGALGRMLLGSVADKVVRGCEGPTLVLPPGC